MDLKKFLDQTVREVKREVNKKVLKVPEIEQKVYEATSNEPWGPHGTLMGDIAQATRNFNEYQMIMAILWKRLNDTGKNWRHVYKSLTVLEFLVANGAERIIDELREHAYQVQTLVDFQYIEPGGKDQGINVRKKAQTLVGLLNDKERIREVRNKAAANRDKYRGVSSGSSFSKSSSYSSTGGGYGDRDQDEDRYGGSSRSGGRDDDRYGGDRERERDRDDRYRDDDRSTRDSYGDRYRDDRDRERFEEDRYGVKGGDGYSNDRYRDDNKYERSASGHSRDRSFEEDERYPPRRGNSSGSKADDYAQDDREPSGLAAAVARAHTSQTIQSQPSSTASQGTERKPAATSGGSYFASKPAADDFDDFDPRGTGVTHQEDNLFATSASAQTPIPAPGPVSVPIPSLPPVKSTTGIEDLFGDSSFGTSFVAAPAPAQVSIPSHQEGALQSEDLFGSSTFMVAQPSTTTFTVPATVLPPAAPTSHSANGSLQSYVPVTSNESGTTFGMAPLAGVPANPASISPQGSMLPQPQPLPPAAPSYPPTNSFQAPAGATQAPNYHFSSVSNPQMSFQQPSFGGNVYGSTPNALLSTSQVPSTSKHAPPKPQQKSFQTKSAIWNDTISSGLVDLNISGPKTNPLAELGIDLKDSIFSAQEKRKEEKAQPTAGNMGRAMGSGTGLGLAGAGGIAAPPPPSAMGGGLNMGMRMAGTGLNPNPGYMVNPGMGVNPGYMAPGISGSSGYGVAPGVAMGPGTGMNPGMGGYGPGIGMVQGVYGPGFGMGGYPPQQYSGYR